MLRLAKTILMVAGGGCALLCAVGFAWALKDYLSGGAGLQLLGIPLSTTSVLIGWIHVVGLIVLAFLCFVIGVSLVAHGLEPVQNFRASQPAQPQDQLGKLSDSTQ